MILSGSTDHVTFRFVDTEKWRKTILYAGQPLKIDGQTIELDEEIGKWDKDGSFKKKVSKWYPQYYHKTDKVRN